MGFDGWTRPLRLRVLLAGMLVLLVAGCGSIGGGDDPTQVPTATVWPTVNDAAEASSPQASPPWQMVEPTAASSPEAETTVAVASTATPETSLPVEARTSPETDVTASAPLSTPETTVSVSAASTPATSPVETTEAAQPTAEATTQAADTAVVQQANPETGDGTSGAPAVSDLPARTPSAATPGATPQASPGASGGSVVTSCEPASVPAFTGTNASFITTSDVNIRIGPGTDCDTAADILPQGTLLTVTSGEVQRDGQTGTTWVRVDVDGLEGWVSTEFLEPDGE